MKCSRRSSPTWCSQQDSSERERLVNEYHNTNYSVVDIDLIERIYGIFYRQKVSGIARHAFHTLTTLERAPAPPSLASSWPCATTPLGEVAVRLYDAVVLATGYERQMHRKLLAPLNSTWVISRWIVTTN